jgi:hypothetical protein
MEFTNPLMLFGLFALTLPVIIHLFNFRRHRLVYFSNVELLKNLHHQTQRTSRLKHLIVLAIRLLLISALVLAFSRPYLPDQNQFNPLADKLVVFYIDNSMSMQARSADASLFDEGRQLALSLANSFQRNDLFVLLTNDLSPALERPMTIEEFSANVDQLSSSASTAGFSQIIGRLGTIIDPEQRAERIVFYISDFQKSRSDFEQAIYDSTFRYFFVPLSARRSSNLYIDSCWFESPVRQRGQSSTIITNVVNHSNEAVGGVPIRLLLNNEQRAVTNLDIGANSSELAKLTFTNNNTGHFTGQLSITDYPVVFDDELYFAFEVVEQLNVLEIFETRSNRWLSILLDADELFNFHSRPKLQLDYQAINDYDIIFLNGLEILPTGIERILLDFVDGGGNLVLIPSENPEKVSAINNFTSNFGQTYQPFADTAGTRVFSLLQEHELFQDVFVRIPDNVDFPSVFRHYPISLQPRSGSRSLINLLNGRPFLTETKSGRGSFYMLASPISNAWTDLQRNALFVPLIYRLAFLSNHNHTLYHTIGDNMPVETRYTANIADAVLRIESLREDYSFIPEHRIVPGRTELLTHDMIKQADHYGLFAGDSLINLLAWNYSRAESVMEFYNTDEVESSLKQAGFNNFEIFSENQLQRADSMEKMAGGLQLWKLFLIFALVFLLAEVLLLRFWK